LHFDSRAVVQGRNLPSGEPAPGSNQQEHLGDSSGKPQRISITISQSLHQALLEASYREGRSLSNLASFWLEQQAEINRRLRSNGNRSPNP
jgi:hypothetical protein